MMRFVEKKNMILAVIATMLLITTSCVKDDSDESDSETDQTLFFSFETPDWEKTIPCTNIDFYPTNEISDGVAFVLATSASTNATFGFPFPADSSEMVLTSNIKKYSVADYDSWGSSDDTSFEMSLKLNKTGVNDNDRLYSVAGLSDDNYNEVTSIEYISSESNYANFLVKGNYKMEMLDSSDTSGNVQVSGSYCIKFRTYRQ